LCGKVTFYQGSVCGSAPVTSDSCETLGVWCRRKLRNGHFPGMFNFTNFVILETIFLIIKTIDCIMHSITISTSVRSNHVIN